jgi:hypothetical protein
MSFGDDLSEPSETVPVYVGIDASLTPETPRSIQQRNSA